jgi:hypothetical protein
LNTSIEHYNNAYKNFNLVEKDIVKITGEEKEQEIIQLNKPEVE